MLRDTIAHHMFLMLADMFLHCPRALKIIWIIHNINEE